MLTMLRRVFWLALAGGAGVAGWSAWQRKNEPSPTLAPTWPPFEPAVSRPAPASAVDSADAGFVSSRSDRWVPPVERQCPDGYPVKGNDSSKIYHLPGGRFYARTVPERCYANEEDAIADGYRAAKS